MQKLWISILFFSTFVSANKSVPLNIHRPSLNLTKSSKSMGNLDYLFKTQWKKNVDFANLSYQSLSYGPKAVPILLNVMKKNAYPVKNRWIAMFSMTKLMGKKSAKVLSKFTNHPDWMMRLGALKCLLFLNQKQFANEYAHLLKDHSLIVRQQALTNIHQMEIKEKAHAVGLLLKDIKSQNENGSTIAQMTDMTIMTVAKFHHKESISTLLEMLKQEQFMRNSATIDYSLEQLTGLKSPKGGWSAKVSFWSKIPNSKS